MAPLLIFAALHELHEKKGILAHGMLAMTAFLIRIIELLLAGSPLGTGVTCDRIWACWSQFDLKSSEYFTHIALRCVRPYVRTVQKAY